MIGLSACSKESASTPDVIVTLKPIQSLVLALTQSTPIKVELLGGGINSPHSYALKPSDMRQLNQAKVIIQVSPDMERFLVKPLSALSRKPVIISLAEIKGLSLLATEQNHHHDEQQAQRPASEHQTTDKIPDLHIWLDPLNMVTIAEHLKQRLISQFPSHSFLIKQNARLLKDQLIQLDRDIKALIAPVKDKKFMVYHNAFHYFENRYGLHNLGSVTLTAHTLPGSRHVVEIKNKMRKQNIVCLFTQQGKQPALVKVLTENSTIKIMPLSPLGITLKPSAGLYFDMMLTLAQEYKSCLSGA